MLVKISNSKLESVIFNKTFQTRAESTLKMFIEALIRIYGKANINKTFIVHVGDFPVINNMDSSFIHLFYCDRENHINIIHDFTFDCWPQAGINSYIETVTKIEAEGKKQYEFNKMLWIGNQYTHHNRVKLLELASNNQDLIQAYNTAVDRAITTDNSLPYISLVDHTKYKYLIDIEGRGYSGRLGMLLFSNRVLFIQDREWKQKFYFDLIPYKHFIPVKNDLADLIKQIEFVEEQGAQYYTEIAKNALEFAKNRLNYNAIIDDIVKILLTYSD